MAKPEKISHKRLIFTTRWLVLWELHQMYCLAIPMSSLWKIYSSHNHQTARFNHTNWTLDDFIFYQMGQISYRWDK